MRCRRSLMRSCSPAPTAQIAFASRDPRVEVRHRARMTVGHRRRVDAVLDLRAMRDQARAIALRAHRRCDRSCTPTAPSPSRADNAQGPQPSRQTTQPVHIRRGTLSATPARGARPSHTHPDACATGPNVRTTRAGSPLDRLRSVTGRACHHRRSLLITLGGPFGPGTGRRRRTAWSATSRYRPSNTARNAARSFRFARRIAAAITGAPTFPKPEGSPRLRSVIRVPPPGASANS